jgi:hypothetical protein
MGLDASRITLDYKGKDYNYSVDNVYDVARRVELILIRKNENDNLIYNKRESVNFLFFF